jgi:hypothetical protein
MSGIIGSNNIFDIDFGHPNSNMQGLIVSLYDIGCDAGSLLSFFIGESGKKENDYGRRKYHDSWDDYTRLVDYQSAASGRARGYR